MKTKLCTAIMTACLMLLACGKQSKEVKEIIYDAPAVFNPPTYVCYKAPVTITIDGVLSPEEWDLVPWTSAFVNVDAGKEPAPFLETKVKITYDDDGLYIAGWMEEPHIWADMTEHDSPLFLNNNFEFFLDPTNDTHNYAEYEINALGTEWDLYLTKPYRDGGISLSNWEFNGMTSAVYIDGTLNNPADTDKAWSVEVFLPWNSVYQLAQGKRKPEAGDQIRANFSRAQWNTQIQDGRYTKIPYEGEEKVGDRFWAWAPSNAKDIHRPEFWGIVQFSDHQAGTGDDAFVHQADDDTKWTLRNLYYRQRQYFKAFGRYAETIEALKAADLCAELATQLTIHTTPSMYEMTLPSPNGRIWHVRHDGFVWSN